MPISTFFGSFFYAHTGGVLLVLVLALWPLLAPAQQLTQRHFGPEQGLAHNRVYDLLQDRQGRVWAATRGGACWYDGTRFHPLLTTGQRADHSATAIAEQADGTLWLGHQSGPLSWVRNGRQHLFHPKGYGDFETAHDLFFSGPRTLWISGDGAIYRCQLGTAAQPADTVVTLIDVPQDEDVARICPGPAGQLFAATAGGLFLLDAATGRLISEAGLPAETQNVPFEDVAQAADTVWWAGSYQNGLLRLSRSGPGRPWRLRRYTEAEGMCSNKVLRVLPDRRGRVWAMTVGGANCLDASGKLRAYPEPANHSAHPGALLEDRESNLWLAHGAVGLNQRLADERFAFFGEAEGLPPGGVLAIHPLSPGVYWLATKLGLLRFEPEASPAQRLRPVALPTGFERTWVRSFCQDRRGGIWVGTSGGAIRYTPATGRWESFAAVPSLDRQRVLGIAEDRRGRMWLATQSNGLSVYDPATSQWRHLSDTTADGPGTHVFWKVLRDQRGTLWFATDDRGVLRLDEGRNGQPDHFTAIAGTDAFKAVSDITADPQGRIWIATQLSRLLCYDGHRLQLVPERLYPGPRLSPEVASIQADRSGRIWLSTGQGLDCYDPRTRQLRTFGPAEGFLGEGAQEIATCLDPTGTLWVGTHQGLMRHQAAGAYPNRLPPLTRLTGLKLFLRDTVAAPGLELAHDQNQLSFDYIGLSLTNPGAVRYRYQLQGFDHTWQGPVASTSATYTNLPPGNYTFAVKAANNEGVWNARAATYSFSIRPPWWRTWWAYLGYAGLFGLMLYGVRHSTRARERQRADRELERQTLNYLRELDRVKTDFFTNVSHEFRTPLTLILGPAEELVAEGPDAPTRQRGGMVLRNARKLLQLINQLLDLSKLEAGALRLHPRAGDVAALARRLVASFESLADSKQIELRCEAPARPLPLVFDLEKLEDVLINLLSNALRFTPTGGKVVVALAEIPGTSAEPAGGVELTVRDTGPGIAAQDLPHLFERFYQAEHPASDQLRTGTGIGLALVRELVTLHGGTVSAASEPGNGATFTVRLPRVLQPEAAEHAEHAPDAAALQAAPTEAATLPAEEPAPSAEAELVLIVEDNTEVRAFIRSSLATAGYRFLEATDGLKGVEMAIAEVPDLVVSDVMMPGLDGYQLCARLKLDPTTSHIPVVLLTAKSGPDAKLEGLETGADSFLAKPFNPRELRAQVRNLLVLRQRMQARFSNPLVAGDAPAQDGLLQNALPADSEAALPALAPDPLEAHAAAVAGLPSLDQKFLQRLSDSVLRHLDNEEFDVEQLVEEMHMSRAQFYRKLKALTGQSPREYIRVTRLHRALALLRAQVGTVAEVAYQVGFSNPAHFSTAFSKQFGYPPSTVAKQLMTE